ncbi:unnamed protein product [Didymodactylos carnosus]|uniref:Uncharacterized protein n=1 Tax=Didymodactylos carnosus TaxID=1234261 RepID=A0A8S2EYJ6_9BILA|nr:unnamed protein product [Didymodactylos carnosus]CAF4083211.1 unnamed protein product [Didymodactylos carnosus]
MDDRSKKPPLVQNTKTNLQHQPYTPHPGPLKRRYTMLSALNTAVTPPTMTTTSGTQEPIMVEYTAIKQRNINLREFMNSDNPVTFFYHSMKFGFITFLKIFYVPWYVIKFLYNVCLRVYDIRSLHPRQSNNISLARTPHLIVVWLLSVIDYIVLLIHKSFVYIIPTTFQQIRSSIHREEYNRKTEALLNDTTKFKVLDTDRTVTR